MVRLVKLTQERRPPPSLSGQALGRGSASGFCAKENLSWTNGLWDSPQYLSDYKEGTGAGYDACGGGGEGYTSTLNGENYYV